MAFHADRLHFSYGYGKWGGYRVPNPSGAKKMAGTSTTSPRQMMSSTVKPFQAATVAFFFPMGKTDGFSLSALRQFSQTWLADRPHMTQVVSSNLSIIAPPQCPHSRAGFLVDIPQNTSKIKKRGISVVYTKSNFNIFPRTWVKKIHCQH